MSVSRLDYGPDMLALFLQAHVMFAGVLAASLPFEARGQDDARARAEREYILDIAALANVRGAIVLRAMRADARLSGSDRHALWKALGIDPDIHNRSAA